MQSRASLHRAPPLPRRAAAAAGRQGFTLIELLVVIGILLLLTTIAIGAYRGVTSADRVSGAARNFKTSLEGARSRAIADGQPRGIRLVLDPNIPHVVTSVVPIGAAEYHEGVFAVVTNDDGSGSDTTSIVNEWQCVDATGVILRMQQRALIAPGSRVEIPAFSNRWYPVVDLPFTDSDMDSNDDLGDLLIRGELFLPDQVPMTAVTEAVSVPYRLQLAPPILPGADPIVFPRGVGIDLNGSVVPLNWRPATTADFYSPSMDIMFSSNGTLTGAITGTGLLHLYFGDVEDIERSAALRGDVPIVGGQLPMVPAQPQNSDQLVTLFTQTGMSVVAEVDHTDVTLMDGTAGVDNLADPATVYRFATAGREAK